VAQWELWELSRSLALQIDELGEHRAELDRFDPMQVRKKAIKKD